MLDALVRFGLFESGCRGAALIVVLCCIQSWPAQAQGASEGGQQPIATFRANSELVLVPVVVADSQGRRVSDLSADDFAILENSKPHTIQSFDRVHGQPRSAPASPEPDLYTNVSPSGALPPPITIILLDSVNTSALDQKNAVLQIAKMLSSPFPGPVAVWQLVPKGIVVVQDFTSDQKELVAAAKRFMTARSVQDLLNTTAVGYIRPYNFLSPNRDYSGTINPYIDVNTEQKSNDSALQDAANQTLEIMGRVAKALRQIQGRKALFWATGGLDSSVENEIGKQLAAANVSVYPIEVTHVSGLHDSPVYYNNRVRYRKIEANGLRALAKDTGGVYCAYAAIAPDCLAHSVADSSDYYMLGFAIDSGHVQPGPHPIEVRVRRPNLQVRARSAYFVENKQGGDGAEIQSAMSSPVDYTALPFAIRLTGRNTEDGSVKLSFRYLVPRGVLHTQGTNDADLDLSFAATAFGNDGKPAGTFSKELSGKLPPETATQLAEKGLFWDGVIQVASSADNVRFVIRDNATGRLGSLTVPIATRSPGQQ